ncbi:hypothetical protein Tco_0531517 [Tanacetum coccineum]
MNVLKASTSKGAQPSASDANHGDSDNESPSRFEDLNFRGFTDEETKVFKFDDIEASRKDPPVLVGS